MTVYLTLVMTVILSLCLALIESTRQNTFFMEAECVTDIGLNSILAEYHRELLAQYNLFAIDSSYGTSVPHVDNTKSHLEEYVNRNLSTEDVFLDWLLYKDFIGASLEEAKLTQVSIMTDQGGRVFRRRAAEAVWDDLNLDLFSELQSWIDIVEAEQLATRDIAAEKHEADKKLEKYDGKEKQISETEWITIKVKNPTATIEKKRKEGILKWAVQDSESLSNKTISTQNLISARMAAGKINQGNLELQELSGQEKLLERFFFQEYLMRYMGHFGAESEEDAWSYQIEYLIAGKDNDLDNLRNVANTICAIREAANTVYIFSDSNKCAIAEAMGTLLASAMTIPEASDILKIILLFGWAYAETTYDMKCLMSGGRVPLMKTDATWHYDLKNALSLNGDGQKTFNSGLSYEDYLRLLMSLQKEDELTARAMDVVEADIRQTAGNENFRLDGCLDSVEACVEIKSVYGYRCEITRNKAYITE
jgi:hypothetical protein